MVKVTESAVKKVLELLSKEDDPSLSLRMFVEGGGCSGFQYGFTFDDSKTEEDFEIPLGDSQRVLLIDAMSMQYINDAEIDYTETLMSSGFNIKNPNVKTTCGCGSSFSV